jgi:hypothetical protein
LQHSDPLEQVLSSGRQAGVVLVVVVVGAGSQVPNAQLPEQHCGACSHDSPFGMQQVRLVQNPEQQTEPSAQGASAG